MESIIANINTVQQLLDLLTKRFILSSPKHISLGEVGGCTVLTYLFFELFKNDERKLEIKKTLIALIRRCPIEVVKAIDTAGNSLLHYSAMANDLDILNQLLKRGLEPQLNVLQRLPDYYSTRKYKRDFTSLYKFYKYNTKDITVQNILSPNKKPSVFPGVYYIHIPTLYKYIKEPCKVHKILIKLRVNKKMYSAEFTEEEIQSDKILLKVPIECEVGKIALLISVFHKDGSKYNFGVGYLDPHFKDEYNRFIEYSIFLMRYTWYTFIVGTEHYLNEGRLYLNTSYIPYDSNSTIFTDRFQLEKFTEKIYLNDLLIYTGDGKVDGMVKEINIEGAVLRFDGVKLDLLERSFTFTGTSIQVGGYNIELLDSEQMEGVLDFLRYSEVRKYELNIK